MPVDSEEKRKGVPRWMTGIPGFGGNTGIMPDGTLDAEDRQNATGVYPGIAAGLPVSGAAGRHRPNGLLLGVY